MAFPQIYLLLPGTAREALHFYADVFGGTVQLATYAEFHRTDGPGDAIAHGQLDGEVSLMAADAGVDDDAVAMTGVMLTILGLDAGRLTGWYEALAEGGRVVDALQQRPWGDWDGTVVDRYGVRWLIGFQDPDRVSASA